MELRYLPAGAVELRERAGRLPTIRGLAIIYNSLSSEITHAGRTFREVVRPGAFSTSIASGAEILARFQHGEIIGRTSDKSLRLMPSASGIRYEVDPYDSADGRNAVDQIRSGKIRGSSFGMIVGPGGDTWRNESGGLVREIHSARLIEVSPVTSPAYRATDVAILSTDSMSMMRMRLALAERE
jgi:HK97 family phage prohead protease